MELGKNISLFKIIFPLIYFSREEKMIESKAVKRNENFLSKINKSDSFNFHEQTHKQLNLFTYRIFSVKKERKVNAS